MRRWLTIILLLVWVGIAGAQTTPPMCSITGNVANADGSPYIGVIKFYNPIVQIINNIPINPMQVSTGTTPAGVINPISLPQGAFFQVTLCPSQSAASGCAATFTAIVPAASTANFGNMAQGTNLTPGIVASSLSVSGPTNLAATTINPSLNVVGTYQLNGNSLVQNGTWTPTFQTLTSNPTVTYNIRVGYYSITGNVVNLFFRVNTNSWSGGTSSDSVAISGIPAAVVPVASQANYYPIGACEVNQYVLNSGYTSVIGQGQANMQYILPVQMTTNTAGGPQGIPMNNVSQTSDLICSLTYQIR